MHIRGAQNTVFVFSSRVSFTKKFSVLHNGSYVRYKILRSEGILNVLKVAVVP